MKKRLLVKRIDDNKSLQISVIEIDEKSDISELNQIYIHLGVDLIDIFSFKIKQFIFMIKDY